uniref:Anoctamin n=1 Tax=Phascolarctos cinereus TaxID=38626 RepID=A0A6P5KGG2_PHACI|nr:anoctamin-7 [Phascolarctos cinereus]XP_020844661.1 anoctamin-7 [Phascolarctos cinereus]XP_020844662.1 anoctamin-7 [Phascolarctos cinereus]XP_020844663.1 anoctamin-7 [Phascolarctos cinereus]XP_020844664.1 anoctamin-7 [Phascolarctos cinereus]
MTSLANALIEFGFITIFVAACPLAPLFALLNNRLEMHLHAHKFVQRYRCPVAQKAHSVGIWFCLLQVMTHVAVFSKALLIPFTSDFLQRTYEQHIQSNDLRGHISFTLTWAPKAAVSKYKDTCRFFLRQTRPKIKKLNWNLKIRGASTHLISRNGSELRPWQSTQERSLIWEQNKVSRLLFLTRFQGPRSPIRKRPAKKVLMAIQRSRVPPKRDTPAGL